MSDNKSLEVEEEAGKDQRETVEEGNKEEGEGEGSGKGDDPGDTNESDGESEQTRDTRILRDRARLQQNTPITPFTKKSITTAGEITTIVRKLRSSIKAPSSAPASRAADKTRRQSKRLSIIATGKLDTTTPTFSRGKRSHDVMTAGSKSANAKLQGNTSARSTADGAPLRSSKRARKHFSYNEDDDDESSATRDTSEALSTDSQTKQKKRKIWLNQGLYLGQGQDLDVRKRPGGKTKKRGKAGADRPAVLPLPMFTGLGVMDTVRNFKLPYNIFAPSPWKCGPIQDWRKLNHSTSTLLFSAFFSSLISLELLEHMVYCIFKVSWLTGYPVNIHSCLFVCRCFGWRCFPSMEERKSVNGKMRLCRKERL